MKIYEKQTTLKHGPMVDFTYVYFSHDIHHAVSPWHKIHHIFHTVKLKKAQKLYLPMQKREKMVVRMSVVVMAPVMDER